MFTYITNSYFFCNFIFNKLIDRKSLLNWITVKKKRMSINEEVENIMLDAEATESIVKKYVMAEKYAERMESNRILYQEFYDWFINVPEARTGNLFTDIIKYYTVAGKPTEEFRASVANTIER